jgi:hypothetical protein
MKKIILSSLVLILLVGMSSAQNSSNTVTSIVAVNGELPQFNWEKTSYSFGKIVQGKPVTLKYEFVNSGNAPLIISEVKPGCGCTVANYTKEAVAPGSKGFVEITYNAAAMGNFSKSVSVTANTNPNLVVLSFNGEVVTETIAPGK